jgi:hypothetical protein
MIRTYRVKLAATGAQRELPEEEARRLVLRGAALAIDPLPPARPLQSNCRERLQAATLDAGRIERR